MIATKLHNLFRAMLIRKNPKYYVNSKKRAAYTRTQKSVDIQKLDRINGD